MINATFNSSDFQNQSGNDPFGSKVKDEPLVSVDKSYAKENGGGMNDSANKSDSMPTPPKPSFDMGDGMRGTGADSDKVGSGSKNSGNSQPKKGPNLRTIVGAFVLLFVVVGSAAGFYLTQYGNFDIRQQAFEGVGEPCGINFGERACLHSMGGATYGVCEEQPDGLGIWVAYSCSAGQYCDGYGECVNANCNKSESDCDYDPLCTWSDQCNVCFNVGATPPTCGGGGGGTDPGGTTGTNNSCDPVAGCDNGVPIGGTACQSQGDSVQYRCAEGSVTPGGNIWESEPCGDGNSCQGAACAPGEPDGTQLCPNPPNDPIVWCATFNCPNGDTTQDGRCNLDDQNASYTTQLGANCPEPASGCGQIDMYSAGSPGDWQHFCGWTYLDFSNCGGGSTPTPTPTPQPLTCNDACSNDSQCSDINSNWGCYKVTNWGSAGSFNGPISIDLFPGSGDMQTQSNIYVGNKIIQSYWRGDQGWLRSVPVVNDIIQWDNASSWSGPIGLAEMPGSGSMQAQTEVLVSPTLMLQRIFRNNQMFERTIPVSGGNVSWSSASDWLGPQSTSFIPGSGNIDSYSLYVLRYDEVVYEAAWRGNQGWLRSVPLSNGFVSWDQASNWDGPFSLSDMPGSGALQAQSDTIYGSGTGKHLQSLWQGNQGFSRTVSLYNRCRLSANPGNSACQPGSTQPEGPMCRDVAILDQSGNELDPSTTTFEIGQVLKFRCAADDPSNQITNYEFRIEEPDGTIVEGAEINPAGNSSTSQEYQINQYLSHKVQCRYCTSSGCQDYISIMGTNNTRTTIKNGQ